jgi:hypothetical protein
MDQPRFSVGYDAKMDARDAGRVDTVEMLE